MNGPDDSSMHSVPTSCTISSHGPADTPVCHPPVCPPCTASPNKKPADTDAEHWLHVHCAWHSPPSVQSREIPNATVPSLPEYAHY